MQWEEPCSSPFPAGQGTSPPGPQVLHPCEDMDNTRASQLVLQPPRVQGGGDAGGGGTHASDPCGMQGHPAWPVSLLSVLLAWRQKLCLQTTLGASTAREEQRGRRWFGDDAKREEAQICFWVIRASPTPREPSFGGGKMGAWHSQQVMKVGPRRRATSGQRAGWSYRQSRQSRNQTWFPVSLPHPQPSPSQPSFPAHRLILQMTKLSPREDMWLPKVSPSVYPLNIHSQGASQALRGPCIVRGS